MHRENNGKFSPGAFVETFKVFDIKGGNQRAGLKFSMLYGDVNWQVYGGAFVSRRLNNSEFDYSLVIEVRNTEEDADEAYYQVALLSVSPSEAEKTGQLQKAFEGSGIEDADKLSYRTKVEALVTYGVYATLYVVEGSNLRQLMKAARQQAIGAQLMYGFYMDSLQNKLGATWRDMQRGEPLARLGIR